MQEKHSPGECVSSLRCRAGTQSTCYTWASGATSRGAGSRGAAHASACSSRVYKTLRRDPRSQQPARNPGVLRSNSTSGARQSKMKHGEKGEQQTRFAKHRGPQKLVPGGDGAALPLAFHSFTPWLWLFADPVISFPSFPASLFLCLAASQLVKTIRL